MTTMDTLTTNKPQSRNYTCATLDQATRVMNSEWSNHDIAALSSSRASARIRLRDLVPGICIGTLAFGTPIRVQPRARADVLLLQMPLRGYGTVHFSGGEVKLDAGRWGAVHAREVLFADYSDECEMLVLRVPMPALRTRLEGMRGAPLRRPLVFENSMLAGSAAWENWAPIHAALSRMERSELPRLAEPVLASLADAAVTALLTGVRHSYSEEFEHPRPPLAPRHVRRAEEYMRTNAHEVLTSAQIAQHAGVSIRTLFDAFVTFRSLTPVQALKKIRLDGAHVDLVGGGSSVTEIALRWGCQHSGRFAASYRHRFGESPAQTLRTARSA